MAKKTRKEMREMTNESYLANDDEKFLQEFEMVTNHPDISAVVSSTGSFDKGAVFADPGTNSVYPTQYGIYDNMLFYGNCIPDILYDGIKNGAFNDRRSSSHEITCMLDNNVRNLIDMINEEYLRMKYSLNISTIMQAGQLILEVLLDMEDDKGKGIITEFDIIKLKEYVDSAISKYFDSFISRSVRCESYNYFDKDNLRLPSIEQGYYDFSDGEDNELVANITDSIFRPAMDVNHMYSVIYAIVNTVLVYINNGNESINIYSVLPMVMGYIDKKRLFTDYANSLMQLAAHYHQKSVELQCTERFKNAKEKVRLFDKVYLNGGNVDF